MALKRFILLYLILYMEDQQDMGIRHRLLFKRFLAEMIELKIVKYVDRSKNGVKRRYFWME